jgi:hypothetical protein
MTFDGMHRMVVRLALAVLVFSALPVSVHAQTSSASVSGSVQDPQGGVMPGVAVTLTSRTQGNAFTTTTDGEGRFVFPLVRPDTYSLQFTLEGFKTVERTNVVVNANDKFVAGTITLDVGQMSEEVTVTSRVSEVQSTSGERGFTLDSEALKNIAAGERSFFTFTSLVPGVLQQGMGGQPPTAADGFTVNGQRPNSNNVTIDGVANIDTGNNGGNMAETNIDAVSEFKILTNAYQAEYGRAVGGQVQVVTKSGTQAFHGSGYWYGRRSEWNANTWLNKRSTPEVQLPKASRDDRGYTIGGPVVIPGLFNQDKRKLFFFGSQEWQSRSDPVAERASRVPTALERVGDFSQSVDLAGNPWPYIRDFTTGLPCSAANTSGCFQDGGVIGRIPANRIYQPGLNALNIYPTPNASLGSGINYVSQAPTKNPKREDLLRLDYQATNSWRVTGRILRTKNDQEQPYGTTWAGAGSNNLDTVDALFQTPGTNYMVSATGILNSTTTLELSWGRAHNSLDFSVGNPLLTRSAADLTGIPLLYPDAVQDDYVPDFRFNGGRLSPSDDNARGAAGFFQTDRGPFTNENTTHDVIANLTKVWGSHTSKAGFYFQHSYKPQSIFSSFNSQINFVDDSNNPFDTSFAYANAATGVFRTYTQASKYALPEWRYKNIEWFLQDNWKVGDRLTLDYGVRFYYLTPQWDTTLQASNFLPDKFDPSQAVSLYRPAIVDGVKVGIDPATGQTVSSRFIGRVIPGSGDRFNGAFQAGQGINDQLQDGNSFKTSPRVGFAYDVTGKSETIIRGGWGMFYDRPQGNMVFDMIANAPGVLVSRFEWGRLQDLSSAGGDPDAVLSLNPTVFNFAPPKVYAWNVGIQQKLLKSFIFDIAYVGSESKDLLRQVQINALPFGATFLPENQDPTREPSAIPGATALPTDLLRPYPGYGNIRMWDYSGYSNYHALQTSVNRRFDNGFSFGVFYVWSKALGINNDDFTPGVPNLSKAETRRLDYSYVQHDRPHNFVVNWVYQTPTVVSGPLGLLANDWQISGIYRWTSGRPYNVAFNIPDITAANLTGTDGNPNARVVLTCDPGSGWSGDPYKQLNTSCFAPPQPGSDGAESARYFVRSPPINNLDLSLSKRFRVKKDIGFEVRLDAFNALNHTQFTGVNNTVNFKSLSDPTITNLPYDASGNLVNQSGFGTINGVAPPRQLQLVTRVMF